MAQFDIDTPEYLTLVQGFAMVILKAVAFDCVSIFPLLPIMKSIVNIHTITS